MSTDAIADKGYTDCRAGLIIFGIIEILIGLACAGFVPLMIFGMAMGAAAGGEANMSMRMMVPALLFYAIIAAWFIWLGVGSVMCRRWARTVLLVTSWIALVCGAVGLLSWMHIGPRMYAAMIEQGDMPGHVAKVTQVVTVVFLAVIYIVAPAVLVIFYGNRHVRATCMARDPKTRWTDKCPPHVLAVSFMFALWGVSMLSMGAYNFTVPFFGHILTGATGAVVSLLVSAVTLWAAWGMYKLRMSAWWTGAAVAVGFTGNAILTMLRIPLIEFYEQMDFPEEQLELLRAMGMDGDTTIVAYMGFCFLAFLGYMVYTRRFMSD